VEQRPGTPASQVDDRPAAESGHAPQHVPSTVTSTVPPAEAAAASTVADRAVAADGSALGVHMTLAGRPRREPVLIAFDNARLYRSALLLAAVFLAVRLAIWAFGRIDTLLLSLLLAWLLAISMEPVVAALNARGLRRGAAVGIVLVGGFLVVTAVVVAFGGAFFSQMAALAQSIPNIARTFVTWLNETFGLTFDPNALADTLNTNTSQIANIATDLAGGVVGILTALAGWIFQLAAVALFAFYFAADGPRLRRSVGRLMPASRQEVFVTVWDTTVTKTGGYVVSKALLALISTVAHALAFAWLDVPYWLPMALWVGVTSQFLPVIGTYLGIALPLLATVFTEPRTALVIVIFATLYQQLENYILVPRVSRRTMDIHPAVAFASVVVGIALFGWIGGLVAIPLTAVIVSVASAYGHRYELIPELAELEAGELVAPLSRAGSDPAAPLSGAGPDPAAPLSGAGPDPAAPLSGAGPDAAAR
jgi:predicted PurR-regulated permease PerM